MAVLLNHTIVNVRDKVISANFLADILGVDPPNPWGPFMIVRVGNDVSLDFADDLGRSQPQHYAFLVSDQEFDQIHARIVDRGLTFWSDPSHRDPGHINTRDGGRGLYWDDPDGHNLEIITVPYGGWPDGT